MNLKVLTIGVVILGVLAGLVYMLTNMKTKAEPYPHLGKALASSEVLEAATRIQINGETSSAVVTKKVEEDAARWILPGFFNAPANLEKLQNLSGDFFRTKVARFVSKRPEVLERLNLKKTRVVFGTKDQESLWSVEIGETGPSAGMYVRFAEGEGAYLSDRTFAVETEESDWVDGKPFDPELKDVDVEKMEFTFRESGESHTVHRKAGKFVWADAPEGKRLRPSELNRLLGGLLTTRVDGYYPKDDEEMASIDKSRKVQLKLSFKEDRTLNLILYPQVKVKKPEKKPEGEAAKEGEEELPETEVETLYAEVVSGDTEKQWAEALPKLYVKFPRFIAQRVPETLTNWLEDLPQAESKPDQPVDTSPGAKLPPELEKIQQEAETEKKADADAAESTPESADGGDVPSPEAGIDAESGSEE